MVAISDPEKLARAIERLREKATRKSLESVIECPRCGAELQIKTTVKVVDGGAA